MSDTRIVADPYLYGVEFRRSDDGIEWRHIPPGGEPSAWRPVFTMQRGTIRCELGWTPDRLRVWADLLDDAAPVPAALAPECDICGKPLAEAFVSLGRHPSCDRLAIAAGDGGHIPDPPAAPAPAVRTPRCPGCRGPMVERTPAPGQRNAWACAACAILMYDVAPAPEATREADLVADLLARQSALIQAIERHKELGAFTRNTLTAERDAAERRLRAALAAAEARAQSVDAALLLACPDNSAPCVRERDHEIGRYLVLNENGDALIEADEPADAIAQLRGVWDRLSEQYGQASANIAAANRLLDWCENHVVAITTRDGDGAEQVHTQDCSRADQSFRSWLTELVALEARPENAR